MTKDERQKNDDLFFGPSSLAFRPMSGGVLPMPELTPEQMAVYREGARRRWLQGQQELARRRERALTLARQAAIVLREDFGAELVVLFGSLAQAGVFDAHSDSIYATIA